MFVVFVNIKTQVNAGPVRNGDNAAIVARRCDNDVVKDYLEKRASEVLSMLFKDISMEDYGEVRFQDGLQEGMQVGLQEGLQNGLLQKAIDAAKKLLGLGVPAETVAEGVGLPLAKVKELEGE